MIKFAPVSRFKDANLPLPTRGTENAAGYDFVVAEDISIPPYHMLFNQLQHHVLNGHYNLNDLAARTKEYKAKPTLVSTGMKCYLEPDTYLELNVRSSTPLKYWLICANSVGVIDADYADNPDNEGEIFFQLINLSPYTIDLKKGDKIGQGIIKPYLKTDDDVAGGKRVGGFGSTSKV
ncbi:MAG: hypothetical protein NC218_09410 [Acetobacter sp.]|nr:hypothetical protein [Acetobacter sp.]